MLTKVIQTGYPIKSLNRSDLAKERGVLYYTKAPAHELLLVSFEDEIAEILVQGTTTTADRNRIEKAENEILKVAKEIKNGLFLFDAENNQLIFDVSNKIPAAGTKRSDFSTIPPMESAGYTTVLIISPNGNLGKAYTYSGEHTLPFILSEIEAFSYYTEHISPYGLKIWLKILAEKWQIKHYGDDSTWLIEYIHLVKKISNNKKLPDKTYITVNYLKETPIEEIMKLGRVDVILGTEFGDLDVEFWGNEKGEFYILGDVEDYVKVCEFFSNLSITYLGDK